MLSNFHDTPFHMICHLYVSSLRKASSSCRLQTPIRSVLAYTTSHVVHVRYLLSAVSFNLLFTFMFNHASSSSSLLSDTESLSLSHPSASRSELLIPNDSRKPMNATPPNTPNAKASPFGLTFVATVNRPPLRNGPTALPAADKVCASPFKAPST